MDWPEIPATVVETSDWSGELECSKALASLCKEAGCWAWAFANQMMPDEGLPLEEALHWACFSRLARSLYRVCRDIENGDSEGVFINCRLCCEDSQNCHLLGQPDQKRAFLVAGHELESDIRTHLQQQSRNTTLDEQDQRTLDALNTMWSERGLPEQLPKRLGEFKRLLAVEREAKSAYTPFKWASQSVHGTSRWLEQYDLFITGDSVAPGAVALFKLRQDDPPLDLPLPIYTMNRGISAIKVLANSIENLPQEIAAAVTGLHDRASRLTTWAQNHLLAPTTGTSEP